MDIKKKLALLLMSMSALGFANLPQNRSDGSPWGISIVGTITNPQSENNVALIKELASGRVHAVKTGYKILKDYDVKEIQNKFIVLLINSTNHLVFQSKFSGEFQSTGTTARGSTGRLNGLFQEDGFERNSGQIKMTAAYRDRLINDQLSEILMQATAVPATSEDGTVIGFRIFQIEADSIFAKAGFQDHDIVTDINGINLNNAAGAIKLLQSLRGAEEVNFSFLRNGVTERVRINVR